MNKFIAEGIGTFGLVFFGTGSIILHETSMMYVGHIGISLVFGLAVLFMIFLFKPYSGAHINPAVTIAFAATHAFEKKNTIYYLISQFMGALTASMLLNKLIPVSTNLGGTIPFASAYIVFIIEVGLTFILMMTILIVSQNHRIEKYTALAVGFCVMLESLVAGKITGASMNPARSLAPAVVSGNWEQLWVYIVAPILGALAASKLWMAVQK